MLNRTAVAIFCVLCLGLGALLDDSRAQQGSGTQDASAAWNTVCLGYGFAPMPVSPAWTFADGYGGSNLEADLDACCDAVEQILASPGTDYDGDDRMSASITNWPH